MRLDEPEPSAGVIVLEAGGQYVVWVQYTDCEPIAFDDEPTARLVAKAVDAAFMAGIGHM